MHNVYDNPKYYEIAFSFRDISAEVDLFEECFKRFSDIPVKSVIELACGNSPHLEEILQRGYRYTGIDLNDEMLQYSKNKASQFDSKTSFIKADIADFSIKEQFDFAYILLGSLQVRNTSQLNSHFDSVAQALKKGGLYLLDWCIKYDIEEPLDDGTDWVIERDDIHVKTTVQWKVIDRIEQTFKEIITLEVNDNGKEFEIVGSNITRAIYPQEFLLYISSRNDFEFIGWWNNWDLSKPLIGTERITRPIALLKRA